MLRKKFVRILACYCFIYPLFSVPKKTIEASAERFSSAECVMEVESRRILFQEHGDVRLPMASTTKIVTALSVLESGIEMDFLNRSR